jgi:hypothetical protein
VFLTIVAEEIVMGHTTSSGKVAKVILELATAEHNFVLTSPVNSKIEKPPVPAEGLRILDPTISTL